MLGLKLNHVSKRGPLCLGYSIEEVFLIYLTQSVLGMRSRNDISGLVGYNVIEHNSCCLQYRHLTCDIIGSNTRQNSKGHYWNETLIMNSFGKYYILGLDTKNVFFMKE